MGKAHPKSRTPTFDSGGSPSARSDCGAAHRGSPTRGWTLTPHKEPARYVGRVGALAVALGVGSAVVAMPLAFADPNGSPGSTGSSSSRGVVAVQAVDENKGPRSSTSRVAGGVEFREQAKGGSSAGGAKSSRVGSSSNSRNSAGQRLVVPNPPGSGARAGANASGAGSDRRNRFQSHGRRRLRPTPHFPPSRPVWRRRRPPPINKSSRQTCLLTPAPESGDSNRSLHPPRTRRRIPIRLWCKLVQPTAAARSAR